MFLFFEEIDNLFEFELMVHAIVIMFTKAFFLTKSDSSFAKFTNEISSYDFEYDEQNKKETLQMNDFLKHENMYNR